MALQKIVDDVRNTTALDATKLSGTLPAISGASLTNIVPADNSITLAKMEGGTDGQIITYDASGDPVRVGPGTDGQVLTSTGAGSPPAFEAAAGGGKLVQLVNAIDSAHASGTTRFNEDNTIPQNTEGDQWMSLAITPTSASNKLWIQFSVGTFHTSGLGTFFSALFQDSTANALAATMTTFTGGWRQRIELTHYMTAGTTSATTFKIRAGNTNAATTTFNGNSGGRYFGGVMSSTLTIMEISV